MKKILTGLIVLTLFVVSFMGSPAFADQDYHERNFFNNFTDWSVTIGRDSHEKQRIIDERTERRAQWRQSRDKRFHQDNGHHDDHR